MEFPNRKYEGLHIPNLISVEDEKKLNMLINCNIFDLLFISKRIGSESQVGTIWLCSINNGNLKCSFIIKVQSNRKKAAAEAGIQSYLSHKWPNNFVITYGSIDCPKKIFLPYMVGKKKQQITLWDDEQPEEPITIDDGNFIFMETCIGDLYQVIRYSIVTEEMLTGYILDVIDSIYI